MMFGVHVIAVEIIWGKDVKALMFGEYEEPFALVFTDVIRIVDYFGIFPHHEKGTFKPIVGSFFVDDLNTEIEERICGFEILVMLLSNIVGSLHRNGHNHYEIPMA